MKNFFLLGVILVVFGSCSKDEVASGPVSSAKAEIKINDFLSEEKMENKIDEIVLQKEQKEKVVLENFAAKNNLKINPLDKLNTDKDLNNQNAKILNSLELYHKEELNNIYELRKELNFTSIQSIADEINSLLLVNPIKSKDLFNKNQKFLVKNKMEVETIFDGRIANVINIDGEVLVNGEKFNAFIASPTKQTGRYLQDENTISGLAAHSGEYFVYYVVGRELHKNSLGVRFFKYFTELKSYMASPNGLVACPSTFNVDSGSIGGFVLRNDPIFTQYTFTYPFISGSGTSVRYVGGNKNTSYNPAGGKISGKFSTTVGGVYQELVCNMKYMNG